MHADAFRGSKAEKKRNMSKPKGLMDKRRLRREVRSEDKGAEGKWTLALNDEGTTPIKQELLAAWCRRSGGRDIHAQWGGIEAGEEERKRVDIGVRTASSS